MQSTLYSCHELITTLFGTDALIPALHLVWVHQMYLFQHFYGGDEKDMSNTILCFDAPLIGLPAASNTDVARSFDPQYSDFISLP